MELKNGETYNGHLVNCDTWMNIHLREVICTSKVAVFLYLLFELFELVFRCYLGVLVCVAITSVMHLNGLNHM